MSAKRLTAGMLAGLASTAAMDTTSAVLAHAMGRERSSPAPLGRWIAHMRSAKLVHDDIRTAAPVPGESLIGIAAHYAIGATLGAGYALAQGRLGCNGRSLPLGLAYGVASTGFAWFGMFPAWGFGLLGRRGPEQQWAVSLTNHLAFGLALGLLFPPFLHAASGRGAG